MIITLFVFKIKSLDHNLKNRLSKLSRGCKDRLFPYTKWALNHKKKKKCMLLENLTSFIQEKLRTC